MNSSPLIHPLPLPLLPRRLLVLRPLQLLMEPRPPYPAAQGACS